nr:PREDICTED: regulator of microtubule dynamics protein 1 [Struthio camelus australis]
MGRKQPHEVQQREMQSSPLLRGNNLMHKHRLGVNQVESSFAEKDLRILVDNKLTRSQQHALVQRQPMALGKGFTRGVLLSTGSFLVYETYRLISRSAEVHASFKVEEVIEQADYLYGSGETEKLYRLLVQHKNSEDAELLWRLARASRDLAQLSSTSTEEKKQLVYEALEYAKKALEKNESNFAAHKWYAICISDVGDYEGIKAKIANAFVIKEHFQKAIELNPKDATSIHLMGIWCYSFAEMPWYQRKIAAMLFATPPTSTYKEALRYFHMAEEADPNFYSKNLLFLGKTYLKLNNKKMALLWLSKAKDYPAHTEEDKQVQKEALELLNSI